VLPSTKNLLAENQRVKNLTVTSTLAYFAAFSIMINSKAKRLLQPWGIIRLALHLGKLTHKYWDTATKKKVSTSKEKRERYKTFLCQ